MSTLVAEYAAVQADRLTDPSKAWGLCAAESTQLAWHLNQHGPSTAALVRVTGQTYPGREHWALILDWTEDGDPADFTVVDLTARQFDPNAPYPWEGTLVDWYDDVCDWLNDHINVQVYEPTNVYAITREPIWSDAYGRDDHEPGEPMRAGITAYRAAHDYFANAEEPV